MLSELSSDRKRNKGEIDLSNTLPIHVQFKYLILNKAERMDKQSPQIDLHYLREVLKDNIKLWKQLDADKEKSEDSLLARTLSDLVNQGFLEQFDTGIYEITESGSLEGGKLETKIIDEVEFSFSKDISHNLSGKELMKAIYENHVHQYDIPDRMILTDQDMANLAEKKYRENTMMNL